MKYLFTDSSPFYELAVFMMVFAAAMACAKIPSVRLSLALGVGRFGELLRNGDCSPAQNLARRTTSAGSLAHRCRRFTDLYYVGPGDRDRRADGWRGGGLLAVMICIGLATPLAAALMALLLNLIFDNVLYCSNMPSRCSRRLPASSSPWRWQGTNSLWTPGLWQLSSRVRCVYNKCGQLYAQSGRRRQVRRIHDILSPMPGCGLESFAGSELAFRQRHDLRGTPADVQSERLSTRRQTLPRFLAVSCLSRHKAYDLWHDRLGGRPFLAHLESVHRFCAIVWGLIFVVFTACVWLIVVYGLFRTRVMGTLFWNRCS